MFRNYLKIAVRNLLRHKGYTIINILGLAVSMAVCIIIFLYIRHEVNYDRFHEDHAEIYRVSINGQISGDFFEIAKSNGVIGPTMYEAFPEITSFTRITGPWDDVIFSFGDRKFYEDNYLCVDSNFFDFFSFRLLEGDPATCLVEPYSLVLSESLAHKYFGDESPVGQMVRLNEEDSYRITGVVEDCPAQSHFQYQFLGSISTRILKNNEHYDDWGSLFLHTYIKVPESMNIDELEAKFPALMDQYMEEFKAINVIFEPFLQPITRIHLHSHMLGELSNNSDIAYIYIFGAVAALVLVIACINFMNLTTARSMRRSREVAMRKVIGADRKALVRQFLGESILLSIIGLLIALVVVEVSLSAFNQYFDVELKMDLFNSWFLLPFLLLLIIFVGVMAGSYPAFYLSAFQPITILKGKGGKSLSSGAFRNVLVVVQFSISVILLVCTGIIYLQMDFVNRKSLGFEKERVVVAQMKSEDLLSKYETMKGELENLSFVASVTASNAVPGMGTDGTGYVPEGVDESSPWIIYTLYTHFGYAETLGLKLKSGRTPDPLNSLDSTAILVNETLVSKLGWDDPIGKKIYSFGADSVALNIVGVVENFHLTSLHDVVGPMLIRIQPDRARVMSIKLKPGDTREQLAALESKWGELAPSIPFDYFFLDDRIDNMYKSERKMIFLFLAFTGIAIFIACLGLFGLASYIAEQKTREIGIRKAFGASVSGITLLMGRQFILKILLANLIAWPVAYLIMDRWLERFAYRIEVYYSWWLFIAAALVSLIIALATVSYQAISAALSDPVESLKYE